MNLLDHFSMMPVGKAHVVTRPANKGLALGTHIAYLRAMTHPLAKFRKDQNLTLKEMGALIGLTRGAVSDIERGRRNIDPRRVPAVSEKTGIPAAQLRPDVFGEAA
jgi:hypothetical protein